MPVRWRPAPKGNIGITCRIDHPLGHDRFATSLALYNHPNDRIAFHDRGDEQAVKHRDDPRLLDQRIGHDLEAFSVKAVADRLRFRHRCAHGLGPVFKLAADAFAVDRGRVAIPRKTLHPDLGDIAAEAAKPFEQDGFGTGAGRSEGRSQSARTRSHHQHIGLTDHGYIAGGFVDNAGHRCNSCQSGAT